MTEMLYNTCYGGFGLSEEAIKEYIKQRPNVDWQNVERNDPVMVAVVRNLGARANGQFAKIQIATVPAPLSDKRIRRP